VKSFSDAVPHLYYPGVACFSPNTDAWTAKLLAVGSPDSLLVYSVSQFRKFGRELQPQVVHDDGSQEGSGQGCVRSIGFAPREPIIAAGYRVQSRHCVRVWRSSTAGRWHLIAQPKHNNAWVYQTVFDAAGRLIVGDTDGALVVWDRNKMDADSVPVARFLSNGGTAYSAVVVGDLLAGGYCVIGLGGSYVPCLARITDALSGICNTSNSNTKTNNHSSADNHSNSNVSISNNNECAVQPCLWVERSESWFPEPDCEPC